MPSAVISIECPGANEKGQYHNAVSLNVAELEAKQDVLFEKLQALHVPNIAIGDLGNEIGMGTVSDWGCYAMIAALAYLRGDADIMHTPELGYFES